MVRPVNNLVPRVPISTPPSQTNKQPSLTESAKVSAKKLEVWAAKAFKTFLPVIVGAATCFFGACLFQLANAATDTMFHTPFVFVFVVGGIAASILGSIAILSGVLRVIDQCYDWTNRVTEN